MRDFILLRLSVFVFLGVLAFVQVKQYLTPPAILIVLFASSAAYFLICYYLAMKRIPPS